jgi:transcriptional regulator of arginine metabolism
VRRRRHKIILDLIREREISSQEELMRGLKSRNIEVSQSTLSRDIQELKLAKTGGIYTVVDTEPMKPSDESVRRIFRESVEGLDVALNIVVVKTGAGRASIVADALDDLGWSECVGSIAGENTVFVAARSPRDGKKLEHRLRELLES